MTNSSDIAIKVRSLSKAYQIRHQQPRNAVSLWKVARGRWPWKRRVESNQNPRSETFWALKDVSFDVPRGKVLGIIGENGAGKSTLLKILSRITEPTQGWADLDGRISSLLEVGTGFHPELSGRENIYLNGSLLGMRRREIDQAFDEIVEFSGVARFIDTPVKRYSSGMYVRLAFSVAAHLEPEVLIVDEVLAVGDIHFQKSCIRKMEEVKEKGRTVLLVSHNLSTINALCDQCLLLDGGKLSMIGETLHVTSAYFSKDAPQAGLEADFSLAPPGDDSAQLISVRLIGSAGEALSRVRGGEPFGIEITYRLLVDTKVPVVPSAHFYTGGQCAFISSPSRVGEQSAGLHRAIAWIPPNLLNNCQYNVNIGACTVLPTLVVHFHVRDRISFSVVDEPPRGRLDGLNETRTGLVNPILEWTFQ